MAQVPPQHCPRCGTEIVPEQKFCATCGLPRALQNTEQQALPPAAGQVSMGGFSPPSQQPGAGQTSMGGFSPPLQQPGAGQVSMGGFSLPSQQPGAGQASMGGFLPPSQQSGAGQTSMGGYPPPLQQPGADQVSMGGFSLPSQQSGAGQASMGGYPPSLQQPGAGQASMGGYPPSLQQSPAQQAPVFNPAPPSGKRKIGRNGIVLLSVALLLILIALGYLVLQSFGVGKPAQAPIATTAINTTVTYASTDLTILNMQQSQNFLDDPHTTQDGMVRLQIQAKNTSGQPVALAYKNIAHLVLSNGKEVAAVYASGNPTIVAGAMQTSNVDFTLPAGGKVDLVRLGAANEAQMDVPLNGHADVSKYAAKTIKVSKQLTYLNIDWTLVDATSQLSFNGQQANKGMRYITVTFSVSNPLMQTVISGSPYVYMHLKAGTSETTPINANLSVSFDAGTSGKTGTATFQAPQDSSTLTLTLSAAGSTGFDPATATFQL